MKPYMSFGVAFLFCACTAAAEPNPMTKTLSPPSASNCDMVLSFDQDDEISNWRTVLDGVMGGRSTGNRFAENDYMVFKGSINTNGGGFSSIRRTMTPGDMRGASRLALRVKQDGRSYRLTFRTRARFRGRSISYQLPIPQTPVGEWAEVEIPLENFRTSVFGYDVPAPPFDTNDVWEMGIILADGIDGPFQLNITRIGCVGD